MVSINNVIKQALADDQHLTIPVEPKWLSNKAKEKQFFCWLEHYCETAGTDNNYLLWVLTDRDEKKKLMKLIAHTEQQGHSLKRQARATSLIIEMMWKVESSRENLYIH